MKEPLPDLPALWEAPSEMPGHGHNGGPPLDGRSRWGSAPEIRETIIEALAGGMPVNEIARLPGMPPATTIRLWRDRDEAFGRRFRSAQEFGWQELAMRVGEEMERLLETHGPDYARRVFAIRRHQLARQAPSFFAVHRGHMQESSLHQSPGYARVTPAV